MYNNYDVIIWLAIIVGLVYGLVYKIINTPDAKALEVLTESYWFKFTIVLSGWLLIYLVNNVIGLHIIELFF